MRFLVLLLLFGILLWNCQPTKKEPLKLVFVTGDEEYRSEESMPMLAKILKRELGCEVTVCYALDSLGNIDPNNLSNIAGLEALEDADLMVMFTRFRALPDSQVQHILRFAESGKPMVGFRTSTHAFLYKEDSTKFDLNAAWTTKVFGQRWITHHGHFNDGESPLTDVAPIIAQQQNPILRGVQPFKAYSWLYHVQGGYDKLYGDCTLLVEGTALRSNHQENNELNRFPLTNPVAWTKHHITASGDSSRVFFTTLGHPFDFKDPSMRKLALNGIYWALGLEAEIPENGVNEAFEGEYNPNTSGFGLKFKRDQKPEVL
jgi:type 1 glutamine amidotransferase